MKNRVLLYLFFAVLLFSHAAFSISAQETKALWMNVPPVPSKHTASLFALGDRQLSYRMTGTMLQNLGNTGGESRYLGDYNYERLGRWFRVADYLDPDSVYVPVLAGYYFSANPETQNLGPVIDYLEMLGSRPSVHGPGFENWRWMAQAVFLARFRMGDMNRAMELASLLASQWEEGRPAWLKQMPAFVLMQSGDKKAAYDLMTAILKEEADQMHPNEVNFMVDYICTRILTDVQASQNSLCIANGY